ncbi:hypothetical protein QUB05_20940 [Microcoleus sp. F10-C6]
MSRVIAATISSEATQTNGNCFMRSKAIDSYVHPAMTAPTP